MPVACRCIRTTVLLYTVLSVVWLCDRDAAAYHQRSLCYENILMIFFFFKFCVWKYTVFSYLKLWLVILPLLVERDICGL